MDIKSVLLVTELGATGVVKVPILIWTGANQAIFLSLTGGLEANGLILHTLFFIEIHFRFKDRLK